MKLRTRTPRATVIPLQPRAHGEPTPTRIPPTAGGVGHLAHFGELLRDAVSDHTYGPQRITDWASAAQQFLAAIADR